jgi:hypothetical protein
VQALTLCGTGLLIVVGVRYDVAAGGATADANYLRTSARCTSFFWRARHGKGTSRSWWRSIVGRTCPRATCREHVAKGTDLGRKAKAFMDAGARY